MNVKSFNTPLFRAKFLKNFFDMNTKQIITIRSYTSLWPLGHSHDAGYDLVLLRQDINMININNRISFLNRILKMKNIAFYP